VRGKCGNARCLGSFVGSRQDCNIVFLVHNGSIEKGFFPQKARKGAEVLTSRIPFGITGLFLFFLEGNSRWAREEYKSAG
jgi:hypothetical protein